MKTAEFIEFGFENCEVSGKIPVENVGLFLIDNVSSKIMRSACNAIDKMDYAEDICVELLPSADRYEWGGAFSFEENELTLFERIEKWADITSISIFYTDGSEDLYRANYDEGEKAGQLGADNVNQKSYRENSGSLIVIISKDKSCKEDFYKE